MKKIIVTLFSVMMIFLSACGSTAEVSEAAPTTEKSSSVKETKSDKNLYKGAGLVIAVTAPEVRNGGKAESWMPQFFQDSITGNLAKYSKMTVLDRANEDLTKAEQELGETGFYTEENAVQLGQMTNAQYAVFGSITALSTSYELNFRAIDITTNEIKAAYNDRATTKEIEDGTIIRAIITELLDGFGIGLTEKEKTQLAKTDKKSLNATKSLAKGAAAEKADNLIEALAFYAEAQENGATKKEASAGINSILGTNGTVSGNAIANLKAQAEYEKQQTAKWQRIFKELDAYFEKNLFICIYDFSNISARLDNGNVTFDIKPGAKLVPIRKLMLIGKQIAEEWEKIKQNPQNANWTRNVNSIFTHYDNAYWKDYNSRYWELRIGLYDDTDYCIRQGLIKFKSSGRNLNFSNIKPQNLYFSEIEFSTTWDALYNIPLANLPENSEVYVKPIGILDGPDRHIKEMPVMSIEEYNEWAKDQ